MPFSEAPLRVQIKWVRALEGRKILIIKSFAPPGLFIVRIPTGGSLALTPGYYSAAAPRLKTYNSRNLTLWINPEFLSNNMHPIRVAGRVAARMNIAGLGKPPPMAARLEKALPFRGSLLRSLGETLGQSDDDASLARAQRRKR
jgi:hypothetical protein